MIFAQSDDPDIIRNEALTDFPENITFELELGDNTPYSEALLTYDVERFSCLDVSSQIPVDIEDGTASWTWVMSRAGNTPPGANIWWQWTLVDAKGNEFTTPRQTFVWEDNRFDWRTISADGINLYWYRGEDTGPTLLDAAVAGLDRLETEMGIELQEDVEIYIYGSSEDMREAVLYIQDWAGGVAFSEENIILLGVSPSVVDDWGVRTVPHELAHLVLGQYGRNCAGGRNPTWLEEGLATYAEGEPTEEILADIESGVNDDTFFPVRSLNSAFPADDAHAGRAYSQSYSLVTYLVDNYGREKMAELLDEMAAGGSYDQALENVYEFNTDGLELVWRQDIGAPPRDIPPTPTPMIAAAVPTFEPNAGPISVATPQQYDPAREPAAEADAESSPSPSICAFGLLPLAALIGAAWRYRPVNRKTAL